MAQFAKLGVRLHLLAARWPALNDPRVPTERQHSGSTQPSSNLLWIFLETYKILSAVNKCITILQRNNLHHNSD